MRKDSATESYAEVAAAAQPAISVQSVAEPKSLAPQIPIVKPTQGPTMPGIPADVGNITLRKTLTAVPPSKTIFVSRLAPDLASEDVLAYIQGKTQAENIKVEKFKFSYARDISSFKINVSVQLFETICSGDFWPEHVVVKEYEARNKRNRPVGVQLPRSSQAAVSTAVPSVPKN